MSLQIHRLKSEQRGFTIIELLIATSVLSVILLLVTVMITNIGNLYYKGTTQAQVQDTTRSIVDQLVQDLQFSDGTPSIPDSSLPSSSNIDTSTVPGKTLYALCVGTTRYSYVLDQQIETDMLHVLWRDAIGSGSACSPVNLSTTPPSGYELMGPRSRLTSFRIKSTSPALYSVMVSVAYGENDLFKGADTSDLLGGSDANVTCASGTGNQFCATDRLATSAVRRVNGSF